MARAFFLVSGGILCLAMAYHFGSATASAQRAEVGPGDRVISGACVGTTRLDAPYFTATVDRRFFLWQGAMLPESELAQRFKPTAGVLLISAPVPGSLPIVATWYDPNSSARDAMAMLASGDLYRFHVSTYHKQPSHWMYAGNLLAARTQAGMDSLWKLSEAY